MYIIKKMYIYKYIVAYTASESPKTAINIIYFTDHKNVKQFT